MKWDVKHDRAKKVIDRFLDNAGYWQESEDLVAGLTDEEELFRLAMKAQEKTSAFVSFETSRHLKDGKKAGKTGMIFASLGSWWTKMSTGTS